MSVQLITKQANVCLLDPIRDARWADLVERSPTATIFHHPQWLRVVSDAYRYPMTAVCIGRAGGELTSGLPIAFVHSRLTGSRLVSMPFSDTCGPIVDGLAQEEELLCAVDRERRRRKLRLEVHSDVPA
jgi:CelD/BcsL family acetyltransferase involved in cellulose biosynthesis